MCISEGFPSLPFFVDQDLTRPDGIIRCKQLSLLGLGSELSRIVRAIRILVDVPIEPF